MTTLYPISSVAATKDALEALLPRDYIPGGWTANIDAVLNTNVATYLWNGLTPSKDGYVPGRFWVPGLYSAQAVRNAIAGGADRDAMKRIHTGLLDRMVALVPFAYVEVDHLSVGEQLARYADVAKRAGFNWAMQVFTGGKSVHAYVRYTTPINPAHPVRLENQQLLCAILDGDTQVKNAGRLMRLPGYSGTDRVQPIIHLDATSTIDAEVLNKKLWKVAHEMGFTSLDTVLDVLSLAKRVDDVRKKEPDHEAQEELRAVAAELRATKAAPSDELLSLAYAMVHTSAPLARGSSSPSTAQGTRSAGDATYLSPEAWREFAGLKHRQVVPAPCCRTKTRATGVFLTNRGTPRLYCNRCAHSFLAQPWVHTPTAQADAVEFDVVGTGTGVYEYEPEYLKQKHELSIYDVDFEKKKAKAEAVPAALVAAAKVALEEAKGLNKQVREHLSKMGLPAPAADHVCGLAIATHHVLSGWLGAYRVTCGAYNCPYCGPMATSLQIAATLVMPLDCKDGTFGTPMSKRWLYAYATTSLDVDALLRRWKQAHPERGEGYLCYYTGGANVTLVLTSPIRPHARKVADALVIPEVTEWKNASEIRAALIDLGLRSHRLEPYDIEGLEGSLTAVGRIASSQNLHLAPRAIASVAAGSAWRGFGEIDVKKAKAELKRRKLETEEKAKTNKMVSLRTTKYVSPQDAQEIFAASGMIPNPYNTLKPTPPAPVSFPESNVEDILNDLE